MKRVCHQAGDVWFSRCIVSPLNKVIVVVVVDVVVVEYYLFLLNIIDARL